MGVHSNLPVLLIDVDGVVVTGRIPDGAHWFTDLHNDFDFDKSSLITHFFTPFWADIVTGRDALLPRLEEALAKMGSNTKATYLRDYWFSKHARLNQKVLDWIRAKRDAGHRIMLATNQDHSRADYLMNTLRLNAYCDGIYYSAALGVAKPNPAFFQSICQAEGTAPGDLTLIDDTIANVEAAKAFGCKAHHYKGQELDSVDW